MTWLNPLQYIEVLAPLRMPRSPQLLLAIVGQFDVERAPRYARDEKRTWCNRFVTDATKALGAEVPHWIDDNGDIAPQGKGRETTADMMVEWLHKHGPRYGWRQVDRTVAEQRANDGFPVVVGSIPGRHIALGVPGGITQAGARNFRFGSVENGFGKYAVEFFTHD